MITRAIETHDIDAEQPRIPSTAEASFSTASSSVETTRDRADSAVTRLGVAHRVVAAATVPILVTRLGELPY